MTTAASSEARWTAAQAMSSGTPRRVRAARPGVVPGERARGQAPRRAPRSPMPCQPVQSLCSFVYPFAPLADSRIDRLLEEPRT